jgi:hypothetical protein
MAWFSNRNRTESEDLAVSTEPTSKSMAQLIATIDESVDSLRSSEISSFDLRQMARDRKRAEALAWGEARWRGPTRTP